MKYEEAAKNRTPAQEGDEETPQASDPYSGMYYLGMWLAAGHLTYCTYIQNSIRGQTSGKPAIKISQKPLLRRTDPLFNRNLVVLFQFGVLARCTGLVLHSCQNVNVVLHFRQKANLIQHSRKDGLLVMSSLQSGNFSCFPSKIAN
jgi:hypothetical protein